MDLDQFIDRAKHLPPAPTLLPELLNLLGQPDIDSERVERLIRYDPTLTANVLRLCNSAASGSNRAVSSLDEAILRLGFSQIFRLVVASCGAISMRSTGAKHEPFQRQLWAHSVVSAVSAQKIARLREIDENLAFTAALLHDIGKIVMLDVLDDKYSRLLEEFKLNSYSLIESEQRVFGLHHAELGGRLLARWRFPMNLVAAVCFHYNPAAAAMHQNVAACVYFGNLVADVLGYACNKPNPSAQRSNDEVFRILRLDPGTELEFSKTVKEDFAAVQSLIQIRG